MILIKHPNNMFKKETYIARREQLRKDVKHGIIIIQGNHEAPCNYKANGYWFRQDSTFLYFFGLQREDLVGVLDCDTGKDYIFANDYDIDDIIWTGPLPSVKKMAASVGVKNSGTLAELQDFCDAGCQLQLNVMSLTGAYGETAMHIVRWLLDHDMYSFIGTDVHARRQIDHFGGFQLSAAQMDKVRALARNNETIFG